MRYLKQSTAATIVLGPFVDSTDGVTAETGLTISQADVRLSKNGAAFAQKGDTNAASHMENGYYSCALSTTDTGTLGRLTVCVNESGALPVRLDYMVLSADAYESLCGSTPLPVNATQISGDSAAADELERWLDGTAGAIPELGILDRGTAQSASSTGLVLRTAAAFADDALIGATVVQTGGTNSPQSARITDNALSGDTITVDSWPNGTPGGTITYIIFGTTPDSAGSALDAAGVRSALGMSSANLDTQLAALQADTDNIQTRLPASLVSGRMDVSVGAMASGVLTATAIASDAITAAKVASDAVAEIQSGLATSSALSSVATNVSAILVDTDTTIPALLTTIDTVVDAIEVDTQDIQARLPTALVGGRIDASVGAMASGVVTAAAVATGAIDADAIASDAVTEIQSGLATAASITSLAAAVNTVDAVVDAILVDTGTDLPATLSTIDGRIDTEVSAIKAQTDKLTFNARNEVAADIKAVINDPVVSGSAKTTTWGGTA